MKVVFCVSSCVIGFEGMPRHLKRGEVWDADDPLVKANPSLFDENPPIVHGTRERPIEDATAEPGRKRSIR